MVMKKKLILIQNIQNFLEWKWVDLDEITELVVEFKLSCIRKNSRRSKKILIN